MEEQSDLYKLEHLSLVTKLCSELYTHIQCNDRDLAEYIINLGENAADLTAFKAEIQGIDDSQQFTDALCATLYNYIQRMSPKLKQQKQAAAQQASNDNTTVDADTKRTPAESNTANTSNHADNQRATKYADTDEQKEPILPVVKAEPNIHPSRLQHINGSHNSDRYSNNTYNSDSTYHRHSGKRSRSPDAARRSVSQSDTTVKHESPVLGGIYDGTVTKITDFGCFIELHGFRQKVDGLCHISQLRDYRVTDIKAEFKRNMHVKCKIIAVQGTKIALSVRDVDQTTGADLRPNSHIKHEAVKAEYSGSNNIPLNGVKTELHHTDVTYQKNVKFLSEQEKWEITQLRKMGVLTDAAVKSESTDIQQIQHEIKHNRVHIDHADTHVDENIEIELNDTQPVFLKQQFAALDEQYDDSAAHSDLMKVVRVPDGSLARAALTQSALSKERRELRAIEQQSKTEHIPSNITQQLYDDPMNKSNILASDLRSVSQSQLQQPEWKLKTLMKNMTYGKITNLSIQQQREDLPIYQLKHAFLQAVSTNNILVVIGETGSGKTTQMTQYLLEAGYVRPGTMIGCTQPRRVAAMSVAKRVAEEVGCKLGSTVGYSIRFEDCTSKDTVIKYMTDGMLLRELLSDKMLTRYSVIILDEAHERTINTDILFGLLKSLLQRRSDLKLIVTSATLDAEKFSAYFNNAPIFTIPGRMYPVTILYTKQAELDYLDTSLMTVMQVHLSQPPGDILLFLTGKEEIDTACEILYERVQLLGTKCPPLHVMPVYSALPNEIQSQIFEPTPPGHRKCIIATNIAEASVTLPGIIYVIDPGFVKQKVYDQKLNLDSLQVVPISQASAQQRAGRAGRVAPGKCYRLYTEQSYNYEMLKNTIPEIQRVNLNMIILQLKAIGINDILNFQFMDPPDTRSIVQALSNLYTLGALDDEGLLSRIGLRMSEFPLDPNLSKILIQSTDLGCTQEILTIVAMLSIESVYYRPKDKQAVADTKHAKYFAIEGDHITLLNIYNAWMKSNQSVSFCHDNFFHSRQLKRAAEIRQQIQALVERYKLPIKSCGANVELVQKCICSGFFMNAAKKDPIEGYKTLVDSQPVYIHPSSSLFHRQPEWIIYNTLILTTKEYLHGCMQIQPKWLIEVAPQFYKSMEPGQLSKRKKRERIEPLFDRYAQNQNAWRLSKRQG